MSEKVYILIAGVNGAGKSTFYHSYSALGDFFDFCDSNSLQNLYRVNADEILKELGDWKNTADAFKAGRMALKNIRQYFKDGVSFCQETTLCGHSVFKNIDLAKSQGYKIGVVYVGVESVELAKERVRNRVKHGGHGIDPKDIEKRYYESLKNLSSIIDKCDGILFYDNTIAFRSVAVYNGRELQLTNDYNQTPHWFKKYIDVSTLQYSRKKDPKNLSSEDRRKEHDEH